MLYSLYSSLNFRFSNHIYIIMFITLMITAVYYICYNFCGWFWRFSLFEAHINLVGSLYVIPFVYSTAVYKLRGSLIVWVVSVFAILPRIIYLSFNAVALITNIALLSAPLAVVVIIALQLNWREKQKAIMAEREEERQHYMSQILKAHEEERHRIAQEIHDDTIQGLLAVANRAQTFMNDNAEAIDGDNRIAWIRDESLNMLSDLRRLCLDLRPNVLDSLGLTAAFLWLIEKLNNESDIHAEFNIKGAPVKLSSENEVTIFRIVQEAINNARRHAYAGCVWLNQEILPGSMIITVADDGDGFMVEDTLNSLASTDKMGILGMHQRAELIEASMTIHSEKEKGTTVSIIVPLEAGSDNNAA